MNNKNIVNIQLLRFFAALSVVCAHITITLDDLWKGPKVFFDKLAPFDWGLGVDVFFVISGFIMYYLMHDQFGAKNAGSDFLRRRLLRVVPLYWICTTLMLVSVLAAGSLIHGNKLDPMHVVASYLFIPWLAPTGQPLPFPLLSLGWTLNYEMFFYVVFATALQWPRRTALPALVGSFCLLIIVAAFAPAQMWLLKFWGAPIIGEFLLGIWLARLYISGTRVPLSASIVLISAGLVLAVVFFQFQFYEHLWRLITGGLPAILIGLGVILGPSAGSSSPARLLAVAGDASYALYLTHPFTVKISVLILLGLGVPLGAIYGLTIVAAITVSIAVHFFVEKPVGLWLGRLVETAMSGLKRS